jgi:hypothetical protein
VIGIEKIYDGPGCTAADLMWSDPNSDVDEFQESPRGCGYQFGAGAVLNFAKNTGMCSRVIRAHECCKDGFDYPFGDDLVLTVFSCPDYCEMMNAAAVAIVKSDGKVEICLFSPNLDNGEQRRRVIYPEWILEQCNTVPVFAEAMADSRCILIEI